MLTLDFFKNNKLRVMCLGAHPDDIEIGAGGTILRIIDEIPETEFCWTVFSGNKKRSREALESANLFLKNSKVKNIQVHDFKESYFPFVGSGIKDFLEKLKTVFSPDIVFTHYRGDAHQDHRLISNLTWNTFRDHFILEYEIPKYDGDIGRPNFYAYLSESQVQTKIRYISDSFQTQKEKQWFTEDTFKAILRIRGLESNSTSKYAEAFFCRKIVI